MTTSNLALNASINQKEQSHHLHVHGSIMVYTQETTVSLVKAEPQGINPAILLLKLTVENKPGPMNGTPRHFAYDERGDHADAYKQVQILSSNGDDRTIDIELLG